MDTCIMCSKDSHGRKLCYSCASKKSNVYSVLKQNSRKLETLFSHPRYTKAWFRKFDLYVSNIKRCITKLTEFLEKDDMRSI